jgi:hypothetical protein
LNLFSSLSGGPGIDAARRYSAARTNVGLVLAADILVLAGDIMEVAADIMKSEMRGTISERNREPLNTP